jgi:hypothetical protein
VARFANADPNVNSDIKPDVRSLSFSVDLTQDADANRGRQDFSLQNATTLPINDSPAFLATMKLLTASKQAAILWSLPFEDKLRVLRTLTPAELQARQTIKPYQQLRYWSTVPFRHGPVDVVKYSATPSPDNSARPLQRSNPKGLQEELIRHITEESRMSAFDFGVQFLDHERMTFWGKRQDTSFWIENASVEWKEEQAPFHTIGRLTFQPKSQLSPEESNATYFDVTGNSTPDRRPLGASIAPAIWRRLPAEKLAWARAVAGHNHLACRLRCATAYLPDVVDGGQRSRWTHGFAYGEGPPPNPSRHATDLSFGVNRNIQVQLAFCCPDFGDVAVKILSHSASSQG